jgi:hypothetical protein
MWEGFAIAVLQLSLTPASFMDGKFLFFLSNTNYTILVNLG